MGKSITFGTYTPKKEDDWVDKFYPYIDLHNPCGTIERVEDVVLDNGNLKSMYRNHKVPVVYLAEDTERLIWLTIVDGSEEGSSNNDGNITLELSDKNFELSTKSYSAKYKWKLKTKVKAAAGSKGKTAYIDVYSEDWITKKKQCGRIKISVAKERDKDQFNKREVDKLIEENKSSLSNRTQCIVAADKQLGKMLDNDSDFITNKSTNNANVYNAYTRIDQLSGKGFVKNKKIFDAAVFEGKGYYKPIKYSSGNEKVVSTYLEGAIAKRTGFHIFYFTILNGYHVLTLVVDATDPCNMKYKIYDQLKDRGDYKAFKEIDTGILEMNSNNWQGAANLTKDKTASTKFGIWKIQRK